MKKIYSNSVLILFLFLLQFACAQTEKNNTGWEQLDGILSNINPPTFQNKTFNIIDYGAIADGVTDCTIAFKNAIEDCSKNGGGKVVVPEGIFLTGAIHLKSNVNLYISENAVVKFSTDKNKYLPVVYTRWEGVECMNYSPLIYAYEQENIAVTGKGILDGQGSNQNWWSWKGKKDYGWGEGGPDQKFGRDRFEWRYDFRRDQNVRGRQVGGQIGIGGSRGHYLYGRKRAGGAKTGLRAGHRGQA